MKKLPWSWFDHRTDLPKWILRGIGQVTVEWSVLERELEETIRLLMDVTLQNGRIITNRRQDPHRSNRKSTTGEDLFQSDRPTN